MDCSIWLLFSMKVVQLLRSKVHVQFYIQVIKIMCIAKSGNIPILTWITVSCHDLNVFVIILFLKFFGVDRPSNQPTKSSRGQWGHLSLGRRDAITQFCKKLLQFGQLAVRSSPTGWSNMLCTGIKGQFDDDIASRFFDRGLPSEVIYISRRPEAWGIYIKSEAPEVKIEVNWVGGCPFIPEHVYHFIHVFRYLPSNKLISFLLYAWPSISKYKFLSHLVTYLLSHLKSAAGFANYAFWWATFRKSNPVDNCMRRES